MDEEVKNFFEKIIEEYKNRLEKKTEKQLQSVVQKQFNLRGGKQNLLFKKSVRKVLNVNRLREQKKPSIAGFTNNMEYKCKIKSIKTKRSLDLLNPEVYRKFYTKKYKKKSKYFLSDKFKENISGNIGNSKEQQHLSVNKNQKQKKKNDKKAHRKSFNHLLKINKNNEPKILKAMYSTGNFFHKRKKRIDFSMQNHKNPFFEKAPAVKNKKKKSKSEKKLKKSFSHKLNEILRYKNSSLKMKEGGKYQKFIKRAHQKIEEQKMESSGLNSRAIKKLKHVNYDHFRGLFQNLSVSKLFLYNNIKIRFISLESEYLLL